MDSREFIKLAKREAVDSCVDIVVKRLKSPRAPRRMASEHYADSPSERIDTWFNERTTEEQRQAA